MADTDDGSTDTHTRARAHSFTGRWKIGKTFMRGTIYLFLELAEIVCSNFAGAVADAAAIVCAVEPSRCRILCPAERTNEIEWKAYRLCTRSFVHKWRNDNQIDNDAE